MPRPPGQTTPLTPKYVSTLSLLYFEGRHDPEGGSIPELEPDFQGQLLKYYISFEFSWNIESNNLGQF